MKNNKRFIFLNQKQL